ncbi:MotA/TolQ/ExbB proton channel family protein [Ekhidna sp.]|uniref:MotA/TolQ/ExbB proton channel family protein n=1 Tax=Ekhidna sp. TaxID=2608089 RepID=UPI0032EAD4C9
MHIYPPLITGVLGQLIGLFSSFEAIQQMESVSPAILAGGLKVSMITTIYGSVIYIIALLPTIANELKPEHSGFSYFLHPYFS